MNRVKEAMIQRDIEVFIVNDLKNNYYLTGNLIDNAPQSLIIWEGESIDVCRYHDEAAARPTSLVENWAMYRDEGPIVPFDPMGVTAEVLHEYKLGNKKIDRREGDSTVLKPGMTFHIFPAFIGLGTIGTSENILVIEDGCDVLGPGILERKLYIK